MSSSSQQQGGLKHVETANRHEVQLWLRQQQAQKRLRRCENLGLISITEHSHRTGYSQTYFIPDCACSSFDWGIAQPLHDLQGQRFLTAALELNPIACPRGCLNYKSTRMAKITKPFKALWAQHFPKKALDYFFKTMDMPTRLFIIALVIVYLIPKAKDTIIEIVRAFQGCK